MKIMMRNIFISIVVLFFSHLLFSQNVPIKQYRKNSVYFELSGNGILIPSFNVERLLDKNASFGIRAGYAQELLPNPMFYPHLNTRIFPVPNYTIPVEIIYLIGKEKHRIEFGIGVTATYYTDEQSIMNENYLYFCRIGSRYTFHNGILIRIAITPALDRYRLIFYEHIIPLGGISLGYSF